MQKLVKRIAKNMLRVLSVFPVKRNKIFFQSFGYKINCNPYYIYRSFADDSSLNCVWCCNTKPLVALSKNTKVVKMNSLLFLYHILTSKVVICNTYFHQYIPWRKGQVLLNTWHGGGAYKQVGNGIYASGKTAVEKNISKYFWRTDYFVSSSREFTNNIADSFGIPKERFLSVGMPRNDMFFNKSEYESIRMRVRNQYGIAGDETAVLYAPTFRNDPMHPEFSDSLDRASLEKCVRQKYGRPVKILFRGHHTFCRLQDGKENHSGDIDVSEHNDMQELICAADILVTDYSSVLWDWSFTYKPAFIFAPDVQEYIEKRGFCTPIESWGFPIAVTNEELAGQILSFNEAQFRRNMEHHHKMLGSFEDGHATEKICSLISKFLRVEK